MQTVHTPEPQAPPDVDEELGESSGNSIRDQDDFLPQNPDMDETMDEIYRDSIQQQPPRSPASPPPNHNPGELPRLPEPESESLDGHRNSSDDENEEIATGDDEEGRDDEDEDVELPFVSTDDPWPQPTLPKLALAKDMIENIKGARLEDDLDEEMLAKLRCPPEEPEMLDKKTLFSISIFNNLLSHSEKTYHDITNTIRQFTGLELDSYHVVKKKIEDATTVTQLRIDMCTNSCVAFTGPFKELDKCPKCNENRYEENRKTKKMQPRRQFYTIPVGPLIQAMWRTPEGADRMRYRDRKTTEIIKTIHATGKIPTYEDVLHGSEYLDACREGRIGPDDTLLMVSLDAAELYRDKESSCWVAIWVLLDLSPDLRYKKKYVLPAFLVPGPNKPDNMESFLLPSFRHVSALQKEGLTVYDGRQKRQITSRPFFGFGTADTVALPILSGAVGHHGNNGCRQSCGMQGRHVPGKPTYYPAALKPDNYTVAKCNHDDVNVRELGSPNCSKYQQDLKTILASRNEAQYKKCRRLTGIVEPSICLGFQEKLMVPVPRCFTLDLMHLVSLNIPSHLISIWRNSMEIKITYENSTKPEFIVLDDIKIWQEHGKIVTATHRFFPDSFGRLPRDPSKKINSGYKAIEWLNYFWVIGPALFRLVLPNHLWKHYCKLVCGIRLLHQRVITEDELKRAHNLLTQWEYDFELLYYQRKVNRLYLVRPCIHAVVHLARETFRCGPLNILAQWVLENTIGNLGREVHQHSNPFMNLCQRGLLRAQTNALKAIIPELDPEPPLPRNAQPIGNGYVLLIARDEKDRLVTDDAQIHALINFFTRHGKPERISDGKFSLQRWSRLGLPNGQTARCAWKEIENRRTRNSRNVKVCTSTFTLL